MISSFFGLYYSKTIRDDYINLIKIVLTGLNRVDREQLNPKYRKDAELTEDKFLEEFARRREEGLDWPSDAETMIGLKRMNNIEYCVRQILENRIKGDLIETGVWRGGACIFMRAILKAFCIKDRIVWVADSFRGLPEPNESLFPRDKGSKLSAYKQLSVSEEEVRHNFQKYNLFDEQVRFLPGWFSETMINNKIKRLALLRLDGDMYESTIDVLLNLYPRLSIGGYCIIDDWGAVKACKQAVEDYRRVFGIEEVITPIDWTGVFWQKAKHTKVLNREDFLELLKEQT